MNAMTATSSASKVTGAHLARTAYLYVRQSTLRQVLTNTESATRQYALRQRAVALGWPAEQVVTIDCDQGQSGASAADREGFQRLVHVMPTPTTAPDAGQPAEPADLAALLRDLCAPQVKHTNQVSYQPGDLVVDPADPGAWVTTITHHGLGPIRLKTVSYRLTFADPDVIVLDGGSMLDVLAALRAAGYDDGRHYDLVNFTVGSGLSRDVPTRLATISLPVARMLRDFVVDMTWTSPVTGEQATVAVNVVPPSDNPLRMRLPEPRPDRVQADLPTALTRIFAPLLGSGMNNEEPPVEGLVVPAETPGVLTVRLCNNGIGPAFLVDVAYDLAAADGTAAWQDLLFPNRCGCSPRTSARRTSGTTTCST